MLESPKPHRYEIKVRGGLSERLLLAFPQLAAVSEDGITVLEGTLLDQAALHGVLHQIEALGLELLDVRCEAADSERQNRRHDGVSGTASERACEDESVPHSPAS